jgi:hypothetical protein
MELTISRAAIEHANGVLVCALQVVSSIGRDKLVVPRMLVWETDIRVSVCSKIFLTYRDIKFAAFRLITICRTCDHSLLLQEGVVTRSAQSYLEFAPDSLHFSGALKFVEGKT